MIIRSTGNPPLIRGPRSTDAWFDVVTTERESVISAGGTALRTENDVEFLDSTPATVDRWSDVAATETVPGTFVDPPTYESLDTGIATVDEDDGHVTRIGDGTARILIRSRLLTRRADVPVSRASGVTSSTFQGYVAGSLAKHCTDAVDSRIAAKTHATTAPLYSSQDHTAGTYTRNASFWAADIAEAFTCISPWNSVGGNLRAGTLVSPRHVVMAEHFPYGVGATVRFVQADNTVVTRTVTAAANVGPANSTDNYATDIRVALLDSDVPAGIAFARVLPSDYASKLPSLTYGVPGVSMDQEEKANVANFIGLFSGRVQFQVPSEGSHRRTFYETVITNDSGNPAFLIVNSQLVLLTTWTFGGAGAGPNYAGLIASIDDVMTTLGGGYTLTTADLSAFPTY